MVNGRSQAGVERIRLLHRGSWPPAEPAARAGPAEPARVRALALTSAACAEGRASVPGTLAALAREMAAVAGGGCIIRPGPPDPGHRPRWALADAHVGSEQRAALRRLNEQLSSAFGAALSTRVGQTRQAVFVPRISAELMRMWSEPAAWPYLEQFAPGSIIAVCLCDLNQVVGSLLVWRDAPARPFADDDLVFAERVAERLGVIVR